MFDIGSLIGSIGGMAAKVGSSVAGLKKPKKSNSGSAAARGAQRAVARTIVGSSQAGHGVSRGLALREGLRAAVDSNKYSDAAAKAAIGDERLYTEQKDARNKRLADFGGDLAKGLGDMAGGLIKPKGGGDVAGSEEFLTEEQAAQASIPGTGVSDTPLAPDDRYNLDDIQQGVDDQANVEQQQLIDQSAQELDDFRAKADAVTNGDVDGGPKAAFQVDPTTQLIETASPSVAPELEQQLADKFHMKELALAEGERLGLSMEEILPRLNRKLQLQPGQSAKNPMGTFYEPEDGEQ